jgi:predicted DNA-binding transcriptional regulator AlpA
LRSDTEARSTKDRLDWQGVGSILIARDGVTFRKKKEATLPPQLIGKNNIKSRRNPRLETQMGNVDINSMPDHAFVRIGAVANLFGVSAQTLKNWAKNGNGPAVVRHGPKLLGFRAGDVKRALASQVV